MMTTRNNADKKKKMQKRIAYVNKGVFAPKSLFLQSVDGVL
jgi:hypothetical protein